MTLPTALMKLYGLPYISLIVIPFYVVAKSKPQNGCWIQLKRNLMRLNTSRLILQWKQRMKYRTNTDGSLRHTKHD